MPEKPYVDLRVVAVGITVQKVTVLPDDPALHRTPEQERAAAIWDDKDVRYVPPAGGMSDATVNPYRRRQQLRINSDRQL